MKMMFALSLILAACGGEEEAGAGDLTLAISGEEAAETGFPVPGSAELKFADGWELEFSRYLVGIGNVWIEGADGEVAVESDDTVLIDLTRSNGEIAYRFEALPARRWERFGYDIVAPTESTRSIGAIEDADRRRMIDGGYNYLVEGIARKDGVEHAFSWGLANPTRNRDCVNGADDTPGVVIRNNATAAYQITLHLDHLFYDRLGAHDGAGMRFEPIGAMWQDQAGRRVIAFESLAEQWLADFRDHDGGPLLDGEGARVTYDPGNVPVEPRHLQAYLLAAARSQGRFNGEGTCVNDAR